MPQTKAGGPQVHSQASARPGASPVRNIQSATPARMTAPSIYRPHGPVQKKSERVAAPPPVFRATPNAVGKAKAPPVYRPGGQVQAKPVMAGKAASHSSVPVRKPLALRDGGPPVYRPQPAIRTAASPQKAVQPKIPAGGHVKPNVSSLVGNNSVAQRAARGWAALPAVPVVPLVQIQAEQVAEEREREMQEAYEEFVNNPDLGIRFYQVDSNAGRAHAHARHTYEGIWAARAVLTAHPTQVAIFATEGALDNALAAMPERQDAWDAGATPGRYDADVGNVHYQGTLLGDTMSLFSCYPTNRNRTRTTVRDALRDAENLEDFKTRVG